MKKTLQKIILGSTLLGAPAFAQEPPKKFGDFNLTAECRYVPVELEGLNQGETINVWGTDCREGVEDPLKENCYISSTRRGDQAVVWRIGCESADLLPSAEDIPQRTVKTDNTDLGLGHDTAEPQYDAEAKALLEFAQSEVSTDKGENNINEYMKTVDLGNDGVADGPTEEPNPWDVPEDPVEVPAEDPVEPTNAYVPLTADGVECGGKYKIKKGETVWKGLHRNYSTDLIISQLGADGEFFKCTVAYHEKHNPDLVEFVKGSDTEKVVDGQVQNGQDNIYFDALPKGHRYLIGPESLIHGDKPAIGYEPIDTEPSVTDAEPTACEIRITEIGEEKEDLEHKLDIANGNITFLRKKNKECQQAREDLEGPNLRDNESRGQVQVTGIYTNLNSQSLANTFHATGANIEGNLRIPVSEIGAVYVEVDRTRLTNGSYTDINSQKLAWGTDVTSGHEWIVGEKTAVRAGLNLDVRGENETYLDVTGTTLQATLAASAGVNYQDNRVEFDTSLNVGPGFRSATGTNDVLNVELDTYTSFRVSDFLTVETAVEYEAFTGPVKNSDNGRITRGGDHRVTGQLDLELNLTDNLSISTGANLGVLGNAYVPGSRTLNPQGEFGFTYKW